MGAIFFFGIIVLFFIASSYIAARICRSIHRYPLWMRIMVWALVFILDISFFLMRLIDNDVVWLNRIVYIISTGWFAVVLYAAVIMGMMDIIRYVITLSGRSKPYSTPYMLRITICATAATMIYGYINAKDPIEQTYSLTTDHLPRGEKMRIAVVSDLHIGYSVANDDIARMVDIINNSGSELTIIAGDIFDGDMSPIFHDSLGIELEKLRTPMGVIAIMGNHDNFGDSSQKEKYLRGLKGITLLCDEETEIGPIHIVGRNDVSHAHRTGQSRRALSTYTSDSTRMLIVVDHQPSGLDEAIEAGADIFIAGHTHAGQIWPINMLTDLIFRHDYGFACFGSTCSIVTQGYGTWGPRQRIGSNSEIVYIDLQGTR